MLPVPPKSSETRAIMLLISRDSEHVQVSPDDPLTAHDAEELLRTNEAAEHKTAEPIPAGKVAIAR
jgi:hypothetical protein